MDPEKLELFRTIGPVLAVMVSAGMAGWVITTWLRIRHGYPLDGAWGQAVYPKTSSQEIEALRLEKDKVQ